MFGTHLGDLGSRSLSYRSGTEFSLSPRESEIRSTYRYKTWQVYIPFHVFHLKWLWRNSVKLFLAIFCVKFPFFPGRTFYLPYLRNGWSNWCETKIKWINWMLCWLGYLWPWILKVKLYLGNGRPDCHGTKGTGVDRVPWCETQPLCDLEAEDTVRDLGDLRVGVSVDSSSSAMTLQ